MRDLDDDVRNLTAVTQHQLQDGGNYLGSVADHVEQHYAHGHSRQPQLSPPQRIMTSSDDQVIKEINY